MRRISFYLAGMVVVLACGFGNTRADDTDGTCPADCAAQCTQECASECEGCPVSKAMAALPKMTYQVADEATCCEEQAAKLAQAHGAPIHFVVADKTHETKSDALAHLADVTEKFVAEFVTPHTCDVSGKTSVCGTSMSCGESAKKMAEIAKAAMETVQVSYKVGDETCHCPNAADALAKESGQTKTYVVADTETCCSIDARIKLAHAKLKAAVMALAKAQQDAETVASTSEA